MTRLRLLAAAVPLAFLTTTPAGSPALTRIDPPVRPAPVLGLTYDFEGKSSMIGANGAKTETLLMRGHASSAGDKTRIDMEAVGTAGATISNKYMISLEGGKRVIWVDPANKTYYETTNAAASSAITPATQAAMNKMMKIESATIDVQRVGSGPSIQGHPTAHYRMNMNLGMAINAIVQQMKMQVNTAIDYYFATDITNLVNPMMSGGASSYANANVAAFLGADFDRQMQAAIAKFPANMAPLRVVATTKIAGDMPQMAAAMGQGATTTFEMLNMKNADVNPSVFEIPAGFTKTAAPASKAAAAPAAAAAMAPSTGSTPNATAQPAKAPQDVQQQIKDAGKMLQGLFGKKKKP